MEYLSIVQSYVTGPGLVAQILLTIVAVIVLYAIITVCEVVVETVKKFNHQTADLFPDTTTTKQVLVQSTTSDSPLIYNSENEVHGMEFSYSMYLFIDLRNPLHRRAGAQ